MVSLGGLARMVFGSANDRRVKSTRPRVESVNAMENEMQALSDAERAAAAEQVPAGHRHGASLDDLLIPAFATVREAARDACSACAPSTCNSSAHGAHNGGIAEMRTGEGKTLVAPCPSI